MAGPDDRSADNGSVLYEIVRNERSLGVLDRLSVFENDLQPGVPYTYTVTAIDNDGNRSASVTIGFTTAEDAAPSGDPSPPPGLRYAVYSGTAAELFWNRSSDDGRVVGYEVTRNGTLVETRDATSYFDDTLRRRLASNDAPPPVPAARARPLFPKGSPKSPPGG